MASLVSHPVATVLRVFGVGQGISSSRLTTLLSCSAAPPRPAGLRSLRFLPRHNHIKYLFGRLKHVLGVSH